MRCGIFFIVIFSLFVVGCVCFTLVVLSYLLHYTYNTYKHLYAIREKISLTNICVRRYNEYFPTLLIIVVHTRTYEYIYDPHCRQIEKHKLTASHPNHLEKMSCRTDNSLFVSFYTLSSPRSVAWHPSLPIASSVFAIAIIITMKPVKLGQSPFMRFNTTLPLPI